MKNMTKLMGMLLIMLLALTLVISGCGQSQVPAKSAEPSAVKLSILVPSDNVDPMQKWFDQAYQPKHPNIKLDIIGVPQSELENKQRIMLTSGQGLDIILGNEGNASDWRAKKLIRPLDDIAKKDNVNLATDFGNVVKPAEDGHIYGVPRDANYWMLFYNKSLFDKAKLPYPDPRKPMTWTEYAQLAQKLTGGQGSNKIYGANYWNWGMMYYGMGSQLTNGQFYKVDGSSNIDDPAFKTSFKFMYDLQNTYKAAPIYAEYTSNKLSGDSFLNGKFAMWPSAQWSFPAFFADKTKYPRDWKIGIAPLPVPDGMTDKHMNWAAANVYCIPTNSQHPDEAFQLSFALATDYTNSIGQLPLYTKIDRSAYFKTLADQFKDEGISLDDMTYDCGGDPNLVNVPEKPTGYGFAALENAVLNDAMPPYLIGQSTLDQAVAKIKEATDKAIQDQKGK